jgi:hypothetical protein
LTGTYTQQTGSLKVTISPQGAITAGAQWNVDGGAWQASGSTVANLILGSHLLAFRVISGWNTPASQTATISNGQTTSLTGTYTQQTGSLKVTITPSGAVSAGAQWNVDSGSWQTSGATVSNLSVGSHTVAFKSITGWTSPSTQTATVSNGQTSSLTGTYTQTGSIRVTITPSGAVSAGAMWSVNGGSTWNASGATVTGLAVGSYTLSFKPVTGWTTPASQSVTITNGGTATPSGVYLQLPTISSISGNGYNDTVGVVNGQWNGQTGTPCIKYGAGPYYNYYAIESQNLSYLYIYGQGFGSNPGTVTASDSRITLNILTWNDSTIKVKTSVLYTYTVNTGVTLTVTDSMNRSVHSNPINVIGIINTRGYGQCTWYVANQRLANHLPMPLPSAYSTTGTIDNKYHPQQWDCLTYTNVHVAIIISAVLKKTVGNITTYTFTVGEMNATCDEMVSTYPATFSVDTTKTTPVTNIGSNSGHTATGYYR